MWFFLTHVFLDANISKMYEGTINDIRFLEVFYRAASEGPNEKKTYILYIYI